MTIRLRKFTVACALVVLILAPAAHAQDHVITPEELDRMAQEAAQTRQKHLERVARFFSSEAAQKALGKQGVNSEKVRKAAMLLGDEELDRLARQVEKVESDFAAGALSNEQLTYIVIALAAAVIVLIAVV